MAQTLSVICVASYNHRGIYSISILIIQKIAFLLKEMQFFCEKHLTMLFVCDIFLIMIFQKGSGYNDF